MRVCFLRRVVLVPFCFLRVLQAMFQLKFVCVTGISMTDVLQAVGWWIRIVRMWYSQILRAVAPIPLQK